MQQASSVFISAIGTANPDFCIPQSSAARFMTEAQALSATDRRKLQVIYRLSGIQQRYSVIPDFAENYGNYTFFPNTENLEPFPGTAARMQRYQQEAPKLGTAAAEACLKELGGLEREKITHLITVSCTGMYNPGLDIDLVHALKLKNTVQRTTINFMGCYAAFNALKMADAICKANATHKVLIVGVELCTLHFQKTLSEDNLLANALFGDGAAAVLVETKERSRPQLMFEEFFCNLAPEGAGEMAWHIGDHGFIMRLSSAIPALLAGGMKKLLSGLSAAEDDLPPLYAVHPGGRRILEAVEQALNISKEDNNFAYQTLRQYGNMSSVTVLFVLAKLLASAKESWHSRPVYSYAFGPGLTLESMRARVSYG